MFSLSVSKRFHLTPYLQLWDKAHLPSTSDQVSSIANRTLLLTDGRSQKESVKTTPPFVRARAIFYDLETTGLTLSSRIVEIAAFDPIGQRSFSTLVNPGSPIPPTASAIHNITDDMVKDAPSLRKAAELFLEFCPPETVLIAHNNDAFDHRFLKKAYKEVNINLPPFPSIDTLKWARKCRPDLPKHSLQFLREIYGFPSNHAHRALDDVLTLQKIFNALSENLSIEEVLKQLKTQPETFRMPFGKHRGELLVDLPRKYVHWLESTGYLEQPENQELKEIFLTLGMLQNRC